MDGEETRRSSIQIPLPSKPRPYRPGDGPPLAPLRLRPERDHSTAHLIDKRVIPGKARNGELQLQMCYVVGWKDLPAARVAILATNILDYVSPGELENFEYQKQLERDTGKETDRRGALKKEELDLDLLTIAKKKKAVKPTSAMGTPTTPDPPTPSGRRRRGRPSKAELQARELSKQASVNDSESIEVTLPPTNTSGPSLSTPQKKRVREIVTDMEEMDEADADDAIQQQLRRESDDAAEDMDIELDGDEDEDDKGEETMSLDRVPEATSSGLEISSYARNLWLHKDTTLIKSANGNLALKSSTSHVPVPEVLRSNKRPWELPAITPLPPPMPKPRKPIQPVNSQPRKIPIPPGRKQSTTPVPVPTPLKSDKKIPRQYPQQFQLQFQPKPEPSVPKPPENKQSTTPVPVPQYPRFTNKKCEPSSSAPPPQPPKPNSQHHGFTPAGRSSGRWPSEIPQSSGELAVNPPFKGQTNTSPPPKKCTPKSKTKSTTGNGKMWVVSRLEGDKLVHAHGLRTRFFKVRWAGEWPPDQNPTWEPEDNIPPELIKAYLKGKAKAATGRRRTTGSLTNGFDSPSRNLRSSPLTLKRKYSSVAEAFAGDADDLDELRNSADSGGEENATVNGSGGRGKRREIARYNYYEDEDGEDEILVVTADQESSFKRRETKPKERMDELGAAFMRDLAAAIQRGSGAEKGSGS
ncbi:uncharacterized protein GGS22DRAFT_148783 [Annulohypoxylon maeteangense]|uniref:uncharacterized protein n=1 Tax=Annulohypoxylon maeteangense TaxID=1927788 RepID=UPI002008482D|nr:uncharacterized protein GGS22DRAFT_148783 [Annulohypoxylon maeteangense]KAI0889633.1 hypothetical protein GGS22DRAFT_148783 [Annulohypoxylon maeteangense]